MHDTFVTELLHPDVSIWRDQGANTMAHKLASSAAHSVGHASMKTTLFYVALAVVAIAVGVPAAITTMLGAP
jgi:hypothetical protein